MNYSTTTAATDVTQNATNQSLHHLATTRVIVLGTTTTVCTVIATYLATTLLIFELRSGKRNGGILGQKKKKKNVEQYARLMRFSTISAAVVGSLTFLSQALQIFLGLDETIVSCDVLKKIDFTLTNFLFISVYALLWLRQRSFYVNPATAHLTSTCTRGYSVVVLVFLFAISLINPVVFNATQWFGRTEFGCKLMSSAFPAQYHWITLALITLFFHVSLLALFVYPLIKHRAGLRQKVKQTKGISSKAKNLITVIRRAFYLALVCVITDFMVVIVNIAVKTDADITPQMVTNVNLLVNIVSIIVTFVDWRSRVLPCCSWRRGALSGDGGESAGLQSSSREGGATTSDAKSNGLEA